jgi:curved DNA-binding protein CbpA
MIWKAVLERKARREAARRRGRRRHRRIREEPEPGAEDEEESYVMTLYDLLGVSRKATSEQIKRAYREKSKRMHPDRTGREDRSFISRLNQAKETLLNAKERRRYDEFLARREEGWIREMTGEIEGAEPPERIKGKPLLRLAPGEKVYKKKKAEADWED